MLEEKAQVIADEARRLLDLSYDTTKLLLKEEDYCGGDETKVDHLKNHLNTLENEQAKLNNNEMVIAVVGTMKAGKSTTINAMVGTEVLPSRNRAMTALPTLIRHVKGKIRPELIFKNSAPIQLLCNEVKQELSKVDHSDLGVDLDEDMRSSIAQILASTAFSETQYEGEDDIFDFLKNLNDLVRLSSAVGLSFPFEEYRSIAQVPVIEVEFMQLAEFDNQKSKLSVLDTPGPNESDQPHLQHMLKEQLKNSSAVFMVMDYTTLGSIADVDVQKSVAQIPSEIPLFTLVNKFDEKDRNGDDEQGVKRILSDRLMALNVPEENIFPVSSKKAYLSNRIRRHLASFDSLPEPETEKWVDDSLSAVVSDSWQDLISIDDREKILKLADKAWDKSLFSKPMTKVLHSAYANASAFAVQSAIVRIKVCLEDYTRDLELLDQGLRVELSLLNQVANSLENRLQEVKGAEVEMHLSIETAVDDVIIESKKKVSELQDSLGKEIKNYFKKGKATEYKAKVLRLEGSEYQRTKRRETNFRQNDGEADRSFIGRIKAKLKVDGRKVDFDPDSPEIELDSRSEAQALFKKISDSIGSIMLAGEEEIKILLRSEFHALEKSLIKCLKVSIDPIREHMTRELEEAGFEVNLNLPEFKQGSIKFSTERVVDQTIKSKTKDVTKYRRSSGVWGGICSFFNTNDWGWETYQKKETFYIVNLEKVEESFEEQVARYMKSISQSIAKSLEEPANEAVTAFFNQFNVVLDSVIVSINTSINNCKLDNEVKLSMSETYQKYLMLCNAMKEDLAELESELGLSSMGKQNAN